MSIDQLPTEHRVGDVDPANTRTKPTITIQEAEEEVLAASQNMTSLSNTHVKNGFQSKYDTDGSYEVDPPRPSTGQPKFAININWNLDYIKSSVGLLRLLFAFCCIISLVCVGNAGTDDIDVLDLPAHSRIRFHIFTCIMVLLVSITIFVLEVTNLKRSMPVNWHLVDVFSSFVLGVLCIVSSTLILHANKEEYEDDENNDGDPNNSDDDPDTDNEDMPTWSNALLALAAVFGYFATLVSVFLIVFKCFNHKIGTPGTNKVLVSTHVQEEIMMSGAERS